MLNYTHCRPLGAHVWTRDALGFYVEPRWCTERLFEVEMFSGRVWDPCCGFGHTADAAYAAGHGVIATDLIDRGYRRFNGTGDFLCSERRVENIVCNPPYSVCYDFVHQALKLTTKKVAMIWLARRINAARWLDNTPLVRVYFLTPRPSMPPGHVIAAGKKPSGGRQDFVWLVWEHDCTGPAELDGFIGTNGGADADENSRY